MKGVTLLFLLRVSLSMEYSWDGPVSTTAQPDANPRSVCLTDQASCGCCLIQKQVQRLEQFFNLTADELNKVLTKSKTALSNIRASRSAFSVALNNVQSLSCYGPFTDNRVIVYKHVFINLGDSYNNSTGFFTVPRTGVYSLTVTIYGITSVSETLSTCANLQVNGRVVSTLFEQNGQDKEDSSSDVVAIQLRAGDRVAVNLIKGCFICDNNNHYNTFTGFLLYATD
ncbi:cerebellin-1-like [Anabas testudineus]|uniref:cerebellin-1-like n=1 Tax=Anabas testudineus TaxID=64144 RepID=UPI000E465C66|nr:cerebellin-1-like [Anabas testudineus]